MNTWTAGVNWYWRSNFKFALNYVKVSSDRQATSATTRASSKRARSSTGKSKGGPLPSSGTKGRGASRVLSFA